MTRLIDLTGQRFNRYLVTGRAPTRDMPSGSRVTYWACVCDCGTEREVSSQNLREGKARSCGCLSSDTARARFRDLAGQRFGRLVSTARAQSLPDGATTWDCACDCGATKRVRTLLLTTGATRSCGCLNSELSAARRWLGDDISYLGMHDRMRLLHGHAKEHPCVDCGQRARDWSYDGDDPCEKREVVNGSDLAFSTDPDHYQPRCPKCHRRYDAARRTA